VSEPGNESYPDGPGWVSPGYPNPPPPELAHYREPPTNPHWIPPRPEPDPMHVDRGRGLQLAGILIILVTVLGVTAMIAFRMAGHH
jgi:hypothetical protein